MTISRLRHPGWLALLAVLLLGSCTFDYGADLENRELLDSIPDQSMTELRHAVIRKGKPVMVIEADRAVIFSRKNYREMEGIAFYQYDDAGTLVVEGHARKARQDIKTEDVHFEGTISLHLKSEGARLETANLSWEAASRRFTGRADSVVNIVRDDGTRLEGRGLVLDTQARRLEFNGASNGTLVTR